MILDTTALSAVLRVLTKVSQRLEFAWTVAETVTDESAVTSPRSLVPQLVEMLGKLFRTHCPIEPKKSDTTQNGPSVRLFNFVGLEWILLVLHRNMRARRSTPSTTNNAVKNQN